MIPCLLLKTLIGLAVKGFFVIDHGPKIDPITWEVARGLKVFFDK